MTKSAERIYAATVNRAAMLLLAMSFRPDLKGSLIATVTVAAEVRYGLVGRHRFTKFDLQAVFDAVVERALAILSAALRQRLPGIADEMDDAFGEKLRLVLGSTAQLIPTL